MKKLVLFLLVLVAMAGVAFAAEPLPSGDLFTGSKPLPDLMGNTIPDTTIITASGTRTYVVDTRRVKDLYVDVNADKNCTVVFTPLIDYDDQDSTETPKYNTATLGAASDTLSVTGGTPSRGKYSDISAPKAKIVVTNSEASNMTSYTFTIRGSVR